MSVALQGTKVLEDREIRLARAITAEGSPPQYSFPGITKYTGALAAPEWKDDEPGRVLLFPLIPCEKHLEPKRQVRNVVLYQGRYLQCPVYITTQGIGSDGLSTEIHRNSTRGPHRAEGTGQLDRLPNRTWYLVQSARTPSHPISICANPGDREKVCSSAFRVSHPSV